MSVILLIIVTVVLFGLLRSTESLLETRQSQRDNGVDTKTYL